MIVRILLLALIVFGSAMLSLLGDWLLIRTRLRNCKSYISEVIYLDEISLLKGEYKVSIVNYTINGKSKDAIIVRGKKDKVGDKVEIVTDGNLAARKKTTIKEGDSTGTYIIIVLVLLFMTQDVNQSKMLYFDVALIITLVFLVISVIIYPLLYETYDKEVKEKLGWRR